MKIAILRSENYDRDSVCNGLAYLFASDFMNIGDVSPARVNTADVVVVEFFNASGSELQTLRTRRKAIASHPLVAIVNKEQRADAIQARALGFNEIVFPEDGLDGLVSTLKRLGSTDPLLALPANTSRTMAEAYQKSIAFLDGLHLAGVSSGAIPMAAGQEVARELVSLLEVEGIQSWMAAVKTHHSPTFSHSLEVAGLAGWFSSQIGWSKSDCVHVTAGGLLHDIGKSRIPLSLLDKAGILNERERQLIQKHAEFGYQIIRHRPEVDPETKEIVVYHHELLDGSGYPFGLSGDKISPKVRLTTICDMYSALTETRSYKAPLSPRQTFAVMNRMKTKIDQPLYGKFRSLMLPDQNDFGRVNRTKICAGE